jgi:hypothetical protein
MHLHPRLAVLAAALGVAMLVAPASALARHQRGAAVPAVGPVGFQIKSVTFTGDELSPKVTVLGSGFGARPPVEYPADHNTSNCGDYTDNGDWFGIANLRFYDRTNDWYAGSGTADGGTCIGIKLAKWTSHKIVFGFGNAYHSLGTAHLQNGDTGTLDVLGNAYYFTALYQ